MISTSKANSVLSVFFGRNDSLAADAYVYLGLSSTDLNADGTGFSEPTGASYKRVLVGGKSAAGSEKKFGYPTNGIISNASEIMFAPAREEWGKLTHWFLATSQSGTGAAFLWGELTGDIVEKGVAAETVPVFYTDELKASIDVPLTEATE